MVENLPVTLASCKSVAEDTYEVVFEYDQNLFSFNAGQYVRITIPKLKFEDPKGASRDFSIASSPNTKGSFSIAFRNTGSGFKKTLIQAEKGFTVEITGPQEIFSLKDLEGKSVVFIAGGIGITPFLSMIRFATEQKLPQKIILLYGNSDKESAAYLEELKKLEKENPNFKMEAIFTHITKDVIKQQIEDITDKYFYLAGPPEMVLNVAEELTGMGIENRKIYIEEFSGYGAKTPVSDDALKIKAKARLDALLEALERVAIVSATDIKGNITYANDKFIEISKYSRNELMGQNHRLIKSGYHDETFYKNLWDTISGGKIWTGEIKNKAKDDTFYWVDSSSIGPTFDEKGKIMGYVAVRFPITKAKEAEEKLMSKNQELENNKRAMLNLVEDIQESEIKLKKINEELNKFQLAAESAYEHIIITDESGKIIYANSAVARTTGYARDEVLGKTPALWKGNMPEEYYKKMWDTIKTKKSAFEGEIKNKRKNGEEYIAQISISPILDENKNIKFYVGLERDVTKEINLTEELRREKESVEKKVVERTRQYKEEQARLEASIKGLSVGFILIDMNSTLLLSNPAIRSILGEEVATIEQIASRLGSAFDLLQYCQTSRLEKKPLDFKDVDFAGRFLHIFIAPVIMVRDSEEVIGNVILVEDETEARVLERSKDEFFSIASHELRTPLTAIRGNSSLIKQYYQDKIQDKDLNEMIDDIHESSVRLIGIVNDFLDISRLEQGKIKFKLENFDIEELISKKVKEVDSLFKEKNLTIQVKKEESKTLRVYADATKLGEVILNLLGNAAKYTDKGGVVVNISEASGFIKVSFADTGKGISADEQTLLFRKFQQAGESILTRDTTKGTGLGLYISKLMIDRMGGKIQLETSRENSGSVFYFTVPVAKQI